MRAFIAIALFSAVAFAMEEEPLDRQGELEKRIATMDLLIAVSIMGFHRKVLVVHG